MLTCHNYKSNGVNGVFRHQVVVCLWTRWYIIYKSIDDGLRYIEYEGVSGKHTVLDLAAESTEGLEPFGEHTRQECIPPGGKDVRANRYSFILTAPSIVMCMYV